MKGREEEAYSDLQKSVARVVTINVILTTGIGFLICFVL